jgi:hypothetical protein
MEDDDLYEGARMIVGVNKKGVAEKYGFIMNKGGWKGYL